MPRQGPIPITADGPSGEITLDRGVNIVTVTAETLAAGATLVLQTSIDEWRTACEHQDPQDATTPAQLDDADSVSGGGYGRSFNVTGPCKVRVYAASFGATSGAQLQSAPASLN